MHVCVLINLREERGSKTDSQKMEEEARWDQDKDSLHHSLKHNRKVTANNLYQQDIHGYIYIGLPLVEFPWHLYQVDDIELITWS